MRLILYAALAVAAAAVSAQTIAPLQTLPGTNRVTYFIGTGEVQSEFRSTDVDLAKWALGAWEKALDGALHFEPAAEDEAQVRVYFVAPNFGQYGEMRPLLVRGRRGAAVYIRPDTNALGDDIAVRAKADPLFRDTIVYLTNSGMRSASSTPPRTPTSCSSSATAATSPAFSTDTGRS